jgi:predicted PurR-regulated permease PerM
MMNFLMALLMALLLLMFVLGMFAIIDCSRQMGVLVNEVRNLKQYIIIIEQQMEWIERGVRNNVNSGSAKRQ